MRIILIGVIMSRVRELKRDDDEEESPIVVQNTEGRG